MAVDLAKQVELALGGKRTEAGEGNRPTDDARDVWLTPFPSTSRRSRTTASASARSSSAASVIGQSTALLLCPRHLFIFTLGNGRKGKREGNLGRRHGAAPHRTPQRMPPPGPNRAGFSSHSFAVLKWPLPRNPRCAESGDGCGDLRSRTLGDLCVKRGWKEGQRAAERWG